MTHIFPCWMRNILQLSLLDFEISLARMVFLRVYRRYESIGNLEITQDLDLAPRWEKFIFQSVWYLIFKVQNRQSSRKSGDRVERLEISSGFRVMPQHFTEFNITSVIKSRSRRNIRQTLCPERIHTWTWGAPGILGPRINWITMLTYPLNICTAVKCLSLRTFPSTQVGHHCWVERSSLLFPCVYVVRGLSLSMLEMTA